MNEPRSTDQPPADPQALSGLKEEWAELRNLLLAPEQTQLNELRDRLERSTLDAPTVSSVLPEAILLRGRDDARLTTALTPHVETALATSVRRTPHVIADAIAPVMGPAIRQAIVRTLQNMMQSLNHTLEHSLSPSGLRWRFEAWQTGKPFAEVVLLHTLRFRVEQVFLIHRDTGLLLHHIAAEAAVVQDQQLVSGMLTAIQSFVQDSFGGAREHTLNTLEVGEFRVLIERGPEAILACVVRGTSPGYLRIQLQHTLESIHLEYAEAFAAFDGNPLRFDSTHARLAECIQAQYLIPRTRISPMIWLICAAVGIGLGFWSWALYQERVQWRQLVANLTAIPGLVITSLEREGDHVTMSGLRDPLTKDPALLLSEIGLQPDHVTAHWAPYYSLDLPFVRQRATAMLNPPPTATLHIRDGHLTATGTVSAAWAAEARQIARLIPGIQGYHDDGLRTISLDQLTEHINRIFFLFDSGSSTLSEQEREKLGPLHGLLNDLQILARFGNTPIVVEAIGAADETGPETMNLLLATARAHTVVAAIGGPSFGSHLTMTTGVETATTIRRGRGTIPPHQKLLRRTSLFVSVKQSTPRTAPAP